MADTARNKEWRNKEYREVNNERGDYVATGSAPNLFSTIKLTQYRGVAQLVARLLWEQDVGGSNPFTPTIKRVIPSGIALFIFVLNRF